MHFISHLFCLEHFSFPISLEAIIITTAIIIGQVFPWRKISMYQRNSIQSWLSGKNPSANVGGNGTWLRGWGPQL